MPLTRWGTVFARMAPPTLLDKTSRNSFSPIHRVCFNLSHEPPSDCAGRPRSLFPDCHADVLRRDTPRSREKLLDLAHSQAACGPGRTSSGPYAGRTNSAW